MRTSADSMRVSVREVMTKKVSTVTPETSLSSAMQLMVSQEIGHLPVVDGQGKLVGILSKTDLVRQQHLADGTLEVPNEQLGSRSRPPYLEPGLRGVDEEQLVKDVMTAAVVTIADEAPLAQAAILMCKHRVHSLPAVSSNHRLTGLLTSMDVVEWVATG